MCVDTHMSHMHMVMTMCMCDICVSTVCLPCVYLVSDLRMTRCMCDMCMTYLKPKT